MAERDIRRNSFRQIISNKLDSAQFTGFKKKLLEAGLTSFNLDDYNRALDRLSSELINPLPDLEPCIVSSNFIDTTTDATLAPIKLFGSGNTKDFRYVHGLFRDNFLFTLEPDPLGFATQILGLTYDHALHPDNLENVEDDLYYERPLAVGVQLYKDEELTDAYQPYYQSPSTTYHGIQSFDEDKDTALKGLLSDAFKDFLQLVANDKIGGGYSSIGLAAWDGPDTFGVGSGLINKLEWWYNNRDFTGGILEVDNTGKVAALYKVMGSYNANGDIFTPPTTTQGVRIDSVPLGPIIAPASTTGTGTGGGGN